MSCISHLLSRLRRALRAGILGRSAPDGEEDEVARQPPPPSLSSLPRRHSLASAQALSACFLLSETASLSRRPRRFSFLQPRFPPRSLQSSSPPSTGVALDTAHASHVWFERVHFWLWPATAATAATAAATAACGRTLRGRGVWWVWLECVHSLSRPGGLLNDRRATYEIHRHASRECRQQLSTDPRPLLPPVPSSPASIARPRAAFGATSTPAFGQPAQQQQPSTGFGASTSLGQVTRHHSRRSTLTGLASMPRSLATSPMHRTARD